MLLDLFWFSWNGSSCPLRTFPFLPTLFRFPDPFDLKITSKLDTCAMEMSPEYPKCHQYISRVGFYSGCFMWIFWKYQAFPMVLDIRQGVQYPIMVMQHSYRYGFLKYWGVLRLQNQEICYKLLLWAPGVNKSIFVKIEFGSFGLKIIFLGMRIVNLIIKY